MPLVRSENVLRQFFMFACVGVAGFAVDSAVLMILLGAFPGALYISRLASYLCAATFTWAANRWLTFPSERSGPSAPHPAGVSGSAVRQWLRFISANAFGGILNLAVYAVLVAQFVLVARHPVIGVAAGSLAGLVVNFTLSRALVFRAHRRCKPTC